MGLRFRERRKCLVGEKAQICQERMREMNLIFVMKLFKENASRWIEDLSRYCRESVDGKTTSMDQTTIEQLSAKQNLSRCIENLSRSYRNKFQKASMDRNCDKICREKKSKGLNR